MSHTPDVFAPPVLTANDRLGLMLLAATAVHALLILGISFAIDKPHQADSDVQSMKITLVHSHSEEAPEDSERLAQANQKGGGNVREDVHSGSPLPATEPDEKNSLALQNQPTAAPRPQMPSHFPSVMESRRGKEAVRTEPLQPRREPRELEAAELLERSREIARLSTEILQQQQQYAQMTREKTISANTREYKYASYMEAWRMKVERIGNLNYPDEAKRRNISGSLIVDVAINADGSLHQVRILRSSGQKVLDDAAVRIVKMGAPYAPFPPSFRNEHDRLHIVRTWQFQSDHRLDTSGR